MAMRWLVGTVLVLLVSFVIYVGSAVWSVKGLVEAAQSGNGPAIIERTDLPRLKRSPVDQFVRAYLERQGAKRPLSLMERVLANTYGASIVDALVGKILTEENITKILRDGVVTEELPDAHMPALAGLDFSNTFGILRRLSPVKIVEFEIALGNDASSGQLVCTSRGTAGNYPALICPQTRYARWPRHCRLSNHSTAWEINRRLRKIRHADGTSTRAVCLQDGLKLDLSHLCRDGFIKRGALV